MLTHPAQSPVPADLDEVIGGYRERIRTAPMPRAVRAEALRQVARLRRVPPDGVEHYVIRGYLEAVIELPWPERAGMERQLLDAMRGSEDSTYGSADDEAVESGAHQDDPCAPAYESATTPYAWVSAATTFDSPDATEQAPKKVT